MALIKISLSEHVVIKNYNHGKKSALLTIQRKINVTGDKLPSTRRHQQYAPEHEARLCLQILSRVQSET